MDAKKCDRCGQFYIIGPQQAIDILNDMPNRSMKEIKLAVIAATLALNEKMEREKQEDGKHDPDDK